LFGDHLVIYEEGGQKLYLEVTTCHISLAFARQSVPSFHTETEKIKGNCLDTFNNDVQIFSLIWTFPFASAQGKFGHSPSPISFSCSPFQWVSYTKRRSKPRKLVTPDNLPGYV
jgi:hypothetical protein